MSELKATPGPWVIAKHQKDTVIIIDQGRRFACFAGTDANARLIAAAPELYEALKNLMAALGGGGKACGHDFDCICAGDKAREALAKARGEAT